MRGTIEARISAPLPCLAPTVPVIRHTHACTALATLKQQTSLIVSAVHKPLYIYTSWPPQGFFSLPQSAVRACCTVKRPTADSTLKKVTNNACLFWGTHPVRTDLTSACALDEQMYCLFKLWTCCTKSYWIESVFASLLKKKAGQTCLHCSWVSLSCAWLTTASLSLYKRYV